MPLPSCFLVCLQKSHEDIPLSDRCPIMVGRTPQTKIMDPRCSRHQVELTADCHKKKVKVKQLGTNESAVDGKPIGKDQETLLGTGSTLFILSGQYPHRISFKGDPTAKKETIKNTQDNIEKEKDVVLEYNNNKDEIILKTTKKRHNNNDYLAQPELKKQKTNLEDQFIKPKHDKKKKDSDDDDDHVKNVANKLEQMKKSLKSKGTPTDKDVKEKKKTMDTFVTKAPSKPIKYAAEATKEDKWTSHEHLEVFTSKGVVHKKKIAGFDVDGTIIYTSSGKTFPIDKDDWRIAFGEIYKKMKKLHDDGFKIVFFTNQLGVARGKIKLVDLQEKLENIVKKLQVPVQIFAATSGGKNRKPCDGMWVKLTSQYNGGIDIDMTSSFFVGDAAGRPADWLPKKKKDFSNSDRLFAMNIDLKFNTPEEYFLGFKKAPFGMPVFDPRELRSDADIIPKNFQLTSAEKEIIILVGYPACGKSHFASHVLKTQGYEAVNRDTLGSWQKCVKRVTELIRHGRVVVDNTNCTKEERARYTECAKLANVECRCFVFTTTVEHCRHNERFRQISDKSHSKINEMTFNTIKKRYQEPSMSEGFSEIVNVNFVPTFTSSSLEKLYRKFLLEK